MKIYGFLNSRSSRAQWAANEAGLDHEFVVVDVKAGGGRTPEFLAINPNGKVPALIDGELAVFESAAICTYIGDKVPEQGLTPKAGSPARARYNQWMFWVMGELEQPLWTIAKHTFVLPEERRVPAIIETAKWEFAAMTKVLSTALGDQSYILGDTFTMADVMIGHTLMWANKYLGGLGHDNLHAYIGRLLARPAAQKTFASAAAS